MKSAPRRRTALRRILVVLVLLAIAAGAWFMVYGGRYLQHEDPLVKADAMFVLAGTRLERPLEAVDLFKEGYAPLIVLSPGRPEPGERLLRQRGIRFPTDSELVRVTAWHPLFEPSESFTWVEAGQSASLELLIKPKLRFLPASP